MPKVVSVEEMLAIEKAADQRGLSYDQMMINAGKAIAEAMFERLADVQGMRVVLLVGSGNNGGDALVVGDHMARGGAQVSAYLAKARSSPDPHLDTLQKQECPIVVASDDDDWQILSQWLQGADVIVDGILGTGAKLPLRGSAKALLQHTKELLQSSMANPYLVAVDCPSGLDCDTGEIADESLQADLTVSLAAAKPGLVQFPGADFVGELVIGDIGIAPDLAPLAEVALELVSAREACRLLPERPPNAHKGTFGTVLIVAGCVNFPGASGLAALGAYRSGAGLVTLAVPSPVQPLVAPVVPEATWVLLPHDMGVIAEKAVDVLEKALQSATCLLLGPGFGTEDATAEFLCRLLGVEPEQAGRQIGFIHSQQSQEKQGAGLPPMVIDADGLKLLKRVPNWPTRLPELSILTPHPGEMAQMTEEDKDAIQADRVGAARKWAAAWGHVVVLKGAYTVIAAPEGRAAILPFATPALASAGTGDVLAGAIAGMRAQGLAAFEAAAAGAYLHALAGLRAGEAIGTNASVMAGDVSEYLAVALRELEQTGA